MAAADLEIHFWTRDVKRAVAFYCDMLGFKFVDRHPDTDDYSWCMLMRGEAIVMFATPPNPETTAPEMREYARRLVDRMQHPGPAATYVRAGDVDELYARLQAAGATLIEPLWDAWWGLREFTVEDPDGNWVTLFKSLAK